MDNTTFKEELMKQLLQLPVAKPVNSTQVVVRCPFCGDSIKDLSHGHFYIKVDVYNDNIPVMYNCFRCKTSGIMKSEVLRSLEIYNLDMSSSLNRYNNKAIKNLAKELGIKLGKLNYHVPLACDTKNNRRKKEYLESRMGMTFTFEELQEFKVVLSLKEFLLANKIEKITTYRERAIEIENDYIGFLSLKNNFITFRDITGNHKYRYIKYTIEQDLLNHGSFYSIPNKIDILSTDTIELHLAEGTFDIMGIYNHVLQKDRYNKIFVSVTGGDYVSPITYFLKLGIVGDVDIHIYSDAEVPRYFYVKHIKKKFSMWCRNIYVHYNELSKDCGVTADEISLRTYKL